MPSSRSTVSALTLVLAACGGGGDGGESVPPVPLVERTLTIAHDASTPGIATDQASISLGGRAFATENASCSLWVTRSNPNDPFSPATGYGCECADGGTGKVEWSNATNGARGSGSYRVGGELVVTPPEFSLRCVPDHSTWNAFSIPLASGANVITVTMQDSQTIGRASIAVTRN